MATQAPKALFILGGSGFIGRQVIREATRLGWRVRALARSGDAARGIVAAGASPVRGDADRPHDWIAEAQGVDGLIDLLQPKFPKRLGDRQLDAMSTQRQTYTQALLGALRSLPAAQRPLLFSVSGVDDLAPDAQGTISFASPQRTERYGLNPIGIPVRSLIEGAAVRACFVYFGTVYGPGKAFAESIFPAVAAGRWKNFGTDADRMALTHLEDAARSLVHLVEMPPGATVGREFVVTDGCPVTMDDFFSLAASLMSAKQPGRVPYWLAALVAGRPLIETMLCRRPVAPTGLPGFEFRFPSYREGLPATLEALGRLRSRSPH